MALTTSTAPTWSPAPAPPPVRLLPPPDPAARVARWGRSSVSPFTLGPGRRVLALPSGGLAGVVPRGRWAVMATDPVSPPGLDERTLAETLDVLAAHHRRPLFAAVDDPARYQRAGLWTSPIADDPIIDLVEFGLSGKRMASIRHSVTSARRAGLVVVPWSNAVVDGAARVSSEWLATKRGGELGFTLGRFDPDTVADLDCRVALDGDGAVVGLVTWHRYDGGRARVLDLMRRAPDAPNPTMDLLIADSLLAFQAAGITTASLGSVPHSQGPVAERVYPTRTLRRYKAKFAPRWEERHLAIPAGRHLPSALVALARAYSPDGLLAGVRRNR